MDTEYVKLISYGGHTEIYRYGRRPRGGRSSAKVQSDNGVPRISENGQDAAGQEKPAKIRSEANARSASLAFRRLIASNLGGSKPPIFATFTYAENHRDISRARKDFNAFAKRAATRFRNDFRYIVVCEFQKRGAVHLHALLWGISPRIFRQERRTRLVARMWLKGFVDLRKTDGSIRLAGYLSKYMRKTFADPALSGRKAYIASRNVVRPIIIKDAILAPHFHGIAQPDLSDAHLQDNKDYDTMWLGKCIYQRYLTVQKL